MTENQDTGIPQKIHALLAQQPGSLLTTIAEFLNLTVTQVETALQQMEKKKIVTMTIEGGCKRYALTCQPSTAETAIQKTCDRIFYLIAENPGLHLSKIAELLNMSKPLAEYHLMRMEKNNQIAVVQETGYKRYFLATDIINIHDKELLAILRKDIPLKIVLYLSKHPNALHKDIAAYLDVLPSTLSYHLNNLTKKGIITMQRYGNERGYNIANKKAVMNVVIRYRLHIIEERFKDLWDDLNYERW